MTNCRKWRKRLVERLDGPFAPGDESELQAHLTHCSPCAREAMEMDVALQWVHDMPQSQPSDNFDWRLRLRLSQLEHEVQSVDAAAPVPGPQVARRRAWTMEFVGSAAAAAVVVLALGLFALKNSTAPNAARAGSSVAESTLGFQATNDGAADASALAGNVTDLDAAFGDKPGRLPDLGPPVASWVRVTPTSAGAPLGPEPTDYPTPSILGEVVAPESIRAQP